MVAITDVAARAGVSTATVSRYLSGQPVRAADRIRAAIADLDYSPSRTARALKSGVTYTVAIVVPDITNPFFASVVKGIESMSRQGPYNISLYNTDEDPDRERQVIGTVVNQVDGIILAPTNEQDQTPELVRRAGIPLVFIDRTLAKGDEFDSVLVDNAGGGAAAARHLLGLGHQRIAIIAGPLDTTPGRQRADGFVTEVERAGVPLPEDYRRISDFREAGGYRETLALLALPAPPTAIFSSNNEMTIGALKALNDMSVSIPGEMAIIGFDDLDLAELLSPPLTVIRRAAGEQGALAMRLLLKRLSGVRERPRSITLDTELVVRGSCGPPRDSTAMPRREGAPRTKGRS
jgi:LacI family transcriptional regulator